MLKSAAAAGPARHRSEQLRTIGEQLDVDRQPLVYEGGVVMPDCASPSKNPPGNTGDGHVERQAQSRRSEAGSRQGASQRGPAEGEGSTGAPAPIVGKSGVSPRIQCDLRAAADAYPQMRIVPAAEVAWLQTWVRPLSDMSESAFLLTQYPFDTRYPVRSWAWWDTGVWIGPRHTNYPHGDICSHEPKDLTWTRRSSLVVLLDLHVLWVVRHMHLRHLGRWPGRQVIHTPYERLREQRPDEMCGCGSTRRYQSCCQANDEGVDPVRALLEHRRRAGIARQRPPFGNGDRPLPEDLVQ